MPGIAGAWGVGAEGRRYKDGDGLLAPGNSHLRMHSRVERLRKAGATIAGRAAARRPALKPTRASIFFCCPARLEHELVSQHRFGQNDIN
eukprot:scaffold13699_cov157-Isochrysis_galbana.AAC.3